MFGLIWDHLCGAVIVPSSQRPHSRRRVRLLVPLLITDTGSQKNTHTTTTTTAAKTTSTISSVSRDSSVSIVTSLRAGGWGSIHGRAEFFSSPQSPDRLWGPHSLSLLSNGEPVLSPEIKWPGREAKQSPPSSAEFENAWSYTFTPHK
jgi:hypothetical protein